MIQTSTAASIKRLVDVTLVLVFLPFTFVLGLLISILVWIDNPGPILFFQDRIGRNGRVFQIVKFRTMLHRANVSHKYLLNAKKKREWRTSYKIKADPRVTRIGKFLRVSSLDEIPQIINVFKGEMSLVGPRPIVRGEIHLYGKNFEIYKQALPGMTGLWQVSGRNDLPYVERVRMDVSYIKNWSIWLDTKILAKTVVVVMSGKGAY